MIRGLGFLEELLDFVRVATGRATGLCLGKIMNVYNNNKKAEPKTFLSRRLSLLPPLPVLFHLFPFLAPHPPLPKRRRYA